jgi:hypothetical protein
MGALVVGHQRMGLVESSSARQLKPHFCQTLTQSTSV